MAHQGVRLTLGPFRGGWLAACREVSWALALGVLYPTACAIVALFIAIGELEATAARGPEVLRAVPYWHEVN